MLNEVTPFILAFCRITVGITFLISFVGKVGNIHLFYKTILNIDVLPGKTAKPIAFVVLGLELFVFCSMLLGNGVLDYGFLIAILMLIAFTSALISVLKRKIYMPCNCFGTGNKPIAPYDVARNIIIIICSSTGFLISATFTDIRMVLEWPEWGLVFLAATTFTVMLLGLRDLVDLAI